jgi:hypothetical protein
MKKHSMFLALLLAGCGGGGGDDSSDDTKFIGVWDVFLTNTSNNCPPAFNVERSPVPTYEINQAGNDIALRNMATNFSANGQTVNNGNGFIATAPTSVAGCFITFGIEFGDVVNVEGVDAADVDSTFSVDCPDFDCSYSYEGFARRK